MNDTPPRVYIIASAAPPVLYLVELLGHLEEAGWTSCVVATPTAAAWIDTDKLEASTGLPVRVHPRLPWEQDPLPPADAIVAAPLTFNTLNKWAGGISDTLALGLLNEALGLDLPVVAAPVIKASLRRHPAYDPSVARLRAAGVSVLDPDAIAVRLPEGALTLDWNTVTQELNRAAGAA
jgi:phosphopantothenoylcysteine decarboxylase